jgi:hypothetical protein
MEGVAALEVVVDCAGVAALDVFVDWAVAKPVMARMRAVVYCMIIFAGVCS